MSRAFGGLVLLLLGAATVVQFNDPDPFRWVLFYGLGALVGALALFKRLWWRHGLGYSILAVGAGAVYLFAAREGIGADWIEDEAVREGGGMLIAGLLTSVVTWLRWREAPHQPSPYVRKGEADVAGE